MITYKGQRTVIGKRFIYEGEVIKYTGKIYGDQFSFISDKDVEYILSESDLIKLKEYNINGEDTNTIKDIDVDDKLRNIVLEYTKKELDLLNNLIAGKEQDINKLNALYQAEYDELKVLNKYTLINNNDSTIPLDAQLSYLKEINRNISGTNIISLLTNLQDFIESNKEV